MRVTGWTNWDDENYIDTDKAGMSYDAVKQAIVEFLKQTGIKFCGGYHQTGEFGVPIIDNKYIFRASFRGWGDVMAKALDLPNEDGMAYCNWAWSTPNNEMPIYPEGE